jgi:hypothetical protein
MDHWPTGNFDTEGAQEYVAELIEELVDIIEEVLDDDERFRLDDDAECLLMPSIELIALLCERYGASPPKVKKIERWRKKYLKMYDKQIDDLEPPPGYKEGRRQVIVKTFAWLEAISQSYHEE